MDNWLSSGAPRGCDVRRGWEVRAAGLFWGVGGIWGMGGTAVAIQGAVGGARHTGSVNERGRMGDKIRRVRAMRETKEPWGSEKI